MNQLDQQLQLLVVEACRYPRGSLERQRRLTRLVALVQQSGKLWRGGNASSTDYEEALQHTWLHVCQKLETYDPQKANVITWINRLLEYRLRDLYTQRTREQSRRATVFVDKDGEWQDPIQSLPGSPPGSAPTPLLDEIHYWVQQESQALASVYVRDRPDINCRDLILSRLPPEKTWQQLSQEWQVAVSTLNSFYRRECLPRLRQLVESKGYR